MKWKIIFILFVVLIFSGYWINKNPAHDTFLGSPPTASKPYHIMDYTKPAEKP